MFMSQSYRYTTRSQALASTVCGRTVIATLQMTFRSRSNFVFVFVFAARTKFMTRTGSGSCHRIRYRYRSPVLSPASENRTEN